MGDIVGYYPDGKGCYDLLKNRNIRCLLGNHEGMMLGLEDFSDSKEKVYKIREQAKLFCQNELEDIRSRLPFYEIYLDSLKMLFVHGSPWNPLSVYVYPESTIAGLDS